MTRLLVLAGFVLPGLWLIFADPLGDPHDSLLFGLIAIVLGLLVSEIIPQPLTMLFFLLAAVLGELAPLPVIFSGFQASAMWLVIGGMLIGAALHHTRLGDHLGEVLRRFFGGSYPMAVLGIALVGLALIFVMPSSTARLLVTLPIAAAFADRLGLERGSSGFDGLVVMGLLGTYLPGFGVLPANYPNLVFADLALALYRLEISYTDWFVIHFPVFGLLRWLLAIVLVLLLFPHKKPLPARAMGGSRLPFTGPQKRLSVILLTAVLLWATDSLHGIAAGWIGMAAGLVCALPILGLIPRAEFGRSFDPGTVFMVAGVIAVGAMVSQAGLAGRLGLDALGPGDGLGSFWGFMAITAASSVGQMVTTNSGLPAVAVPLAGAVAAPNGLSIETVIAAQAMGYGTILVPYMTGPFIFAASVSAARPGVIYKSAMLAGFIAIPLIWPLQYLWLWAIGMVG